MESSASRQRHNYGVVGLRNVPITNFELLCAHLNTLEQKGFLQLAKLLRRKLLTRMRNPIMVQRIQSILGIIAMAMDV